MTSKELINKYPEQKFGIIKIRRNYKYPLTGKLINGYPETDYSDTAQIIDKGWEFYLEHSCDEWIIGNLEEAIEFNENLAKAIEYIKNNI